MTETWNPLEIIDHHRYPLVEYDRGACKGIVARIKSDLAADGCAVLPGFLSRPGLRQLVDEAGDRRTQAYYAPKKHCNVYLGEGNPDLPGDHPQNVFLPRSNGFITADLLGEETAAHRLYHWPPLRRFLAGCLDKQKLHIYADPISNMIVNVARPGQQFNWHFDTNEFTITYLLQGADSGGCFEYVPNLRTPTDECYDEVTKVLKGDRRRVKRLDLRPGDLQFFLGRYSLHRVTRNEGNCDRLLLIQSFTEEPEVIGNPYRVKDLYGKTAAVHRQAARQRVRSDRLMD